MPQSAQDQPVICSIADVFAVLDGKERGESRQFVRFRAQPFKTPDGKRTGFVSAIAECQVTGEQQRIDMPTCSGFVAKLPDGTALPVFGIDRLDGAIAYRDGFLHLNGDEQTSFKVRSVSFQTAPIDYKFSELEHLIVHYALQYIGDNNPKVKHCYRELVPGIIRLDYEQIRMIRITSVGGVVGGVETRLERLMSSAPLSLEMLEEFEIWLGGSTTAVAIKRTLKRSGMIFPRDTAVYHCLRSCPAR